MSRWIGRSFPVKSQALRKAPCTHLTMVDWPAGCLLGSPTLRVGHLAQPSSLHLGLRNPLTLHSRIVHHLCDAEEPEGDQEGSVKVQR